ncbi:MAG TPA: type II toxin-antitoxin system VapC family toxin [Pyrinomonadaceae bacterium]|nr:type II toxin-antitoxin system VapC family toxin [Pyrinomonadaceae bacterium]
MGFETNPTTAWEISIKKALGKLDAPDDLANALEVNNFRSLEITVAHATKAGALPRHHDGPFERLLIAQAQTEQLTVTHDAKFRAYEISVIWT